MATASARCGTARAARSVPRSGSGRRRPASGWPPRVSACCPTGACSSRRSRPIRRPGSVPSTWPATASSTEVLDQAARPRPAPARPPPPEPRVRADAPGPRPRQDRGLVRHRRTRGRPGRRRASPRRCPSTRWRPGSPSATATRSGRAATRVVRPGDAMLVPSGLPHTVAVGRVRPRTAGADRPVDPARVAGLRGRRDEGRPPRPRLRHRAAGRRPVGHLGQSDHDRLVVHARDASRAPASRRSCRPRRTPTSAPTASMPSRVRCRVDAGFAVVLVLDGTGVLRSPARLAARSPRATSCWCRSRRATTPCTASAATAARRRGVPAAGTRCPARARDVTRSHRLGSRRRHRDAAGPEGAGPPGGRGPRRRADAARPRTRGGRAGARGHGADSPADAAAVVVDRPGWIASNVDGMRIVLSLWEGLAERTDAAPAVVRSLGSRGTALQLGAVLAWMSGKVLGQYEAFTATGEPGRLLLVAPTIVHVERQLDVPSRDFRFWVCLHEETHRVQFGAVPWLSDYLADRVYGAARRVRPRGPRDAAAARGVRLRADPLAALRRRGQRRRGDPDAGAAGDLRRAHRPDVPARGPCRRRHGRRRARRRAVGGADPRAVHAAPSAARHARLRRAQGAGHGRQDAPVQRWCGLRAACRRSRRDGRLQPGLDVARPPAVAGGAARPRRLAGARSQRP